MENKRQHGQFFTIYNPFNNNPFKEWWKEAMSKADNKVILEPFAGANNLIYTLQDEYGNFPFASFDIEPQDLRVKKKDTLKNFPKGFDIIITNPPYLAKNSAKRRGLDADFKFDDLYKDCLEKMLNHTSYVAAIIPATFLHWGKLNNRLYAYIQLTQKMFDDTETPVCLALFKPNIQEKVLYYKNDTKLDVSIPNFKSKRNIEVHFNKVQTANLALIAFDNTKADTIKFIPVMDIDLSNIKHTSRNIVCISVLNQNITKSKIKLLNDYLAKYRKETKDIFLTPFKGVRKDGKFRRRIMFKQARQIIKEVL